MKPEQRLWVFVGEDSPAELKQHVDMAGFGSFGFAAQAEQRVQEGAHPLSKETFAWPEPISPVWSGSDTSRCVAAVNVKSRHDEGVSRFLAGTQTRGETALVLVELCLETTGFRRASHGTDAVVLPDEGGRLLGKELPGGVTAHLAPGLEGADRDLGLRIMNTHDPEKSWFAIEPAPLMLTEEGREVGAPRGYLTPLLVDDLGDAIAAVWVPDGHPQRWYVFPCGSSWESILGWLVDQAVPEFVPQAAARVRSLGVVEEALLTRPERAATAALREFETRTTVERAELSHRIEAARASADPTRETLLYGTGDRLKGAVKELLQGCGFDVEDLDETFGEGKSSDLLASIDGRHWMVEARAASGSPGEASVSDVVRHLRTWGSLGRSERIEGGVLVLNHNHREAPAARPRVPYRRPEFVQSLDGFGVTVISTVQLCEWWAAEDCQTVRAAVTGPPAQYPS